MEGPNKKTPEEIAEIEKSRTISDAELLKGGAEYKINEETDKRLVLTKEQMDTAQRLMPEKKEAGVVNKMEVVDYREAFLGVVPLLETPAFIKTTARYIRFHAEEGAKGSGWNAWYAATGAAALHTLGIWDNMEKKTREESEKYMADPKFIKAAAKKVHSYAEEGADGSGWNAWRAATGAVALHTLGIWNKIEKNTIIKTYMEDTKLIAVAAQEMCYYAKEGAKGDGGSARYAAGGVVALHTLGIWDNMKKKTRKEIEKYMEDNQFIATAAEEVRSRAENGTKGNDSSAWDAALGAAALKNLAENPKNSGNYK